MGFKDIQGTCFPCNIHERASPYTEKSIWFAVQMVKKSHYVLNFNSFRAYSNFAIWQGGNGSTLMDRPFHRTLQNICDLFTIYCSLRRGDLFYLESTLYQWKYSLELKHSHLGSKLWNLQIEKLRKRPIFLQEAGPLYGFLTKNQSFHK